MLKLKKPQKPRKLNKPIPPQKTWPSVQELTSLGTSITLDKLIKNVESLPDQTLDYKDIIVDAVYYWDGPFLQISRKIEVDNPNYDREYASYKKKLEKYRIKNLAYEEAMELYEKDLKDYNREKIPEKLKKLEQRIRKTQDKLKRKRERPIKFPEESQLESMKKEMAELEKLLKS